MDIHYGIIIKIHYNFEINNLDTYNLKIIGKKYCDNNTNNVINNKNPYVNWFKK